MTRRPKVVATIECRMGSSRLPGKVMMEAVEGISFLELIVRRVSKCSLIDEIVLATTENTIDDAVEELSSKIGVKCFRGSEEDVLGRVLGAAKSVDADIIVELHGDCPFVDPGIISQVVALYLNNQCDYAKNFEPSSYPDGLDVQAFSVDLLEEVNRLGLTQEDREHVSWYFRTRPDVYKHLTILAPESLRFPSVRLTLDTAEDLTFIKTILPKLYAKNENFDAADVVSELKALGII